MNSERRFQKRISIHLKAQLINLSGEPMDATVTDVSLNGLTIQGDTQVLEHVEVINPQTRTPHFPVEAELVVGLPLKSKPVQLKLRCRQVNLRRFSKNRFAFGMRIVGIDQRQREHLERYIDERASQA